MKILTIILAILTILLAVLSFTLHQKIETRNKVIEDRELQINGYHKILDAIARTETINSKALAPELKKNFKFDKSDVLHKSENGYYLNLYPEKNIIDHTRIWDYMGGFVIEFNNHQKLKAVNLYKP